jgi:hypothetical protein
MAKNDDICPICKEYIDIIVSGFKDEPFINGKKYENICFVCACVPKNSFVIIPVEKHKDNALNTVEEMVAEGFNKKRAEISVKCVKKILKG